MRVGEKEEEQAPCICFLGHVVIGFFETVVYSRGMKLKN